jgi:putative nucleotidyltransferase with HDIG domain
MGARVLAVDDDSQIMQLTVRYLKNSGYEARGITDPRETATLIRSFNPDVCILDINMPFMSGPELLDEIKSIHPQTEVILLTGLNDTMLAVDLMKRGAADFLLKPLEPGQMEIAVSRALEHRTLVIENAEYRLHLEALVEERSRALNEALRNLHHIHAATLETLAMALDMRDEGTSGHSRRVADLAVEMARGLGVAEGDLIQIEHGALLHDIGKLRIPDSILWKPADLTPEEWEIMRRHPEYGYEFVRKIEFLNGAADIILCHHERYDGKGYPRGLKGNEISLGARIFALVDTLDAMVHDRPYHQGISFPAAREKILKLAGTHFDPALVEPALEHLERHMKTRSEARSDSPSDS